MSHMKEISAGANVNTLLSLAKSSPFTALLLDPQTGSRVMTCNIVRVHYFVRGGFVRHRSRASSKHLSPHLPVDELDSSGVKKGLRCRCKMHVWVSGPQRSRLDVDVSEK
ncbi:hypothetical protein TNCV_4991071 [Trichonephila clavipes]|nr:hypothetical protein TNCV_4991071 [Trichonephila clavipes]